MILDGLATKIMSARLALSIDCLLALPVFFMPRPVMIGMSSPRHTHEIEIKAPLRYAAFFSFIILLSMIFYIISISYKIDCLRMHFH